MNLNRAQRRAAKYKRPQTDKVISLTPLIDEFTIFDTPQRILDEIASDRLSINQDDVPVFIDNSGHWQEAIRNARDELNYCRMMFRTHDRKKIQEIAKTSQIAIMLGTS
jgi:hypothetical protein